MDWSFVPGVDLTREPVVTKVDGGTLHEWPGCRVFVPGPPGDQNPDDAEPNGCRSHYEANQDPVGAILDALSRKFIECRMAKEFGAAIVADKVDPKSEHALGRAAPQVEHWQCGGSSCFI